MIHALLQLIAPDDCLQCGAEGRLWCDWCHLDSDYLPSRCFRCHEMTSDFEVCSRCRKAVGLNNVFVALEYKGIAKELVHALKYQSKRQAADVIAKSLHHILPYFDTDVLITHVPTARSRVRQRGFDHTALISQALAKKRRLTFSPLLIRHGNERQVGSTKQQRQQQAKDLYTVRPRVGIKGKNILLIDDVVTTGATLAEASRVLRKAGAKSVMCAAFAYTK